MVDLHIAVWAQKKGISMYTLPRKKNWMTEFEEIGDNRIWQQANENRQLQNQMMFTLCKIEQWNCNTISKFDITNGPLKAHKNWLSRELPPNMILPPTLNWPALEPNPKVTIYIPAYNVEHYIEECVDSALAQTYENFEISIHDDGSSDNTWNILKSKYGSNPKIILNSLPNKGIGFATNSAINNGDGELILQLDSDDFIEPDTLHLLVEALQKGYVCAYGNFRRIRPDGSLIDNGWEAPGYNRFRLMKDMVIHPPRLYRRDVWEYIGKHNEKLVNAEDFDLFLRISEVGKMIHVRKILYSYRILDTSSTRSKSDIMTVNTHDVINSALERQKINKFEITIANPNFPRRVSFNHVSFSEL
jgi:glycosyltransferase involved in cell wall biosynthesis